MAKTRGVYVTTTEGSTIIDYWSKRMSGAPVTKIHYVESSRDNPYPKNLEAYLQSVEREDLTCIMHDDTIVFNHDILEWGFSMAEKGYAVTPLQRTFAPPAQAEEYLHKNYNYCGTLTPSGKREYSFLLNFLFLPYPELIGDNCNSVRMDNGIGGDIGFGVLLRLLEKRVPIVGIDHYAIGPGVHDEDHCRVAAKEIERLGWTHVETVAYLIERLLSNSWKDESRGGVALRGLAARVGFLYEASTISKDTLDKFIKHYNLDTNIVNCYRKIFK